MKFRLQFSQFSLDVFDIILLCENFLVSLPQTYFPTIRSDLLKTLHFHEQWNVIYFINLSVSRWILSQLRLMLFAADAVESAVEVYICNFLWNETFSRNWNLLNSLESDRENSPPPICFAPSRILESCQSEEENNLREFKTRRKSENNLEISFHFILHVGVEERQTFMSGASSGQGKWKSCAKS